MSHKRVLRMKLSILMSILRIKILSSLVTQGLSLLHAWHNTSHNIFRGLKTF